jgi:1-acyl-sn-glycerol-3-phosphate acyltransferase
MKARPLYKFWLGIRSTFFWLFFLPATLIAAILVSAVFFLPPKFSRAILQVWISFSSALLRFFCGLKYQVEGLENIPDKGFILMSKHSSTWETIILQKFFKPLVWVVKRELTRVPFFGWSLITLKAIALDRGTGSKAIKQLVRESKQRMDQGLILILFPEGTRVLPKQHKPFKIGGAIVSEKTGYSVVPIAHNAGEFWPRHSWIKWPGTIQVVIGKPIEPEGKKPDQIIREVEQWITTNCDKISDHQQLLRLGIQ